MTISDERFELNMQGLEADGLPGTAAELRARDTAQREALRQLEVDLRNLDAKYRSVDAAYITQREALARVEAERDTAVVQMQNIRKERDAINKELGDAGFNLCIAQQQLAEAVGLLREVNSQRFTTLATVEIIESFIGRHSQTFHDRAQAEHQEAQSAQAGDERELFNRAYEEICNRPITIREIARRMWMTRAALATQPAEYPAGAVENGRTLMSRLEQWYTFADDQGHALAMCKEWLDLKECFEHMADALSAARGADHA